MEVNNNVAKLICELEAHIGGQCYNPKSYNGWTGEEGCAFRYPVWIRPNKESKEPIKCNFNLGNEFRYRGTYSIESIVSMKYMFGSNHLFIGKGLVEVLNALEKRYELDFAALENEYLKKHTEI